MVVYPVGERAADDPEAARARLGHGEHGVRLSRRFVDLLHFLGL